MYDSKYPFWNPVGYASTPDTFSLNMIDTTNLSFSVQWYLDDSPISGATGFSYVLDPSEHSLGTANHTLKCRFRDTTWYVYRNNSSPIDTCPFVRTDPDSVMTDSVCWTLQYGIGVEQAVLASHGEPSISVLNSGSFITCQANPIGQYQLTIHDIRGRLVADLGNGFALRPFAKQFRPSASGIYIIRLIANGKTLAKKAAFLR
jgi:hypothetical protein